MGQSEHTNSLTGLLDQIQDATEQEQVSIRDLVAAAEKVSFTPLLMLPAIALVTPLSGIPLFSATMGVLIFLVSSQLLIRSDHIWLPRWLLNLKTGSRRVRKAIEWARAPMAWLGRRAHTRLRFLTHRPLILIPQFLCVLSGLALPLLEFVPFSSSLMGVAVSLLAIGLLARDGIILLLGCLPYVAIIWLILRAV